MVDVDVSEGEFTPLSQFDDDTADPDRFLDRVCDRIEVARSSYRKHERDRCVEDGKESAGDDEQASLVGGWF